MAFRSVLESRQYVNQIINLYPSRTFHTIANLLDVEIANWCPVQKAEKGAYVTKPLL